MTPVSRPTPLQVRQWMQQRQADKVPPPSPAEVRRALGWGLINVGAECAR